MNNQKPPKPRRAIRQIRARPTQKSRANQEGPENRNQVLRAQQESNLKTARHTMNPPVSCPSHTFLISNSRRSPAALSGLRAERPTTDFGAASPRVRLVGSRGWMRPKVMASPARIGGGPVQLARSLASRGMKRKASSPAFFTERTLAAHLAVSDRTIRNWIRRGELPSYKLGASRRIDPADVEDFLARHRDEAA